ncbi:MAG: YraN family protein [Rickettsiales bacterium]|nr:YraN family protein [Rickettsiales bacterium]
MLSKKYKGLFAEYYSALYLIIKGYTIHKLRFRTKFGETDIIAIKKDVVIFVEVKYVCKLDFLYRAIFTSNSSRLSRNAKFFMRNGKYNKMRMRFDIIYVYGRMRIRHLKNVYFQT